MQNENKLKHLEFVQNIVNRMAQNSFLLKSWAVALVSALMALAAAQTDQRFTMITYLATPLFWALDGYYLHQERLFRELFKNVATGKVENFIMETNPYKNTANSWCRSCFSHTIAPFYGLIFFVVIFMMFAFPRISNG